MRKERQDKAEQYMQRLELEVIIKGFEKGVFPDKKENLASQKVVPLRAGKLAPTPFGVFIGRSFEFDGILAINYYGHYKLSTGILDAVLDISQRFPDVRSIRSHVVYFNAIKIEHIQSLSDKGMQLDFPIFKRELVELRWG